MKSRCSKPACSDLVPVCVVLSLCLLLPACSGGAGPTPAGPALGRPVGFSASDGVQLRGRLFGTAAPSAGATATTASTAASTGIVLSHTYADDERSWFEFASKLADQGYLVLAYDFRGFCPGSDGGCSSGTKDVPSAPTDVLGAIAYIRDQGVTQVFLMGAIMGGTASLIAASNDGEDIAGVVTLSAPATFSGLSVGAYQLERIFGAKLFIAGAADAQGAASAQQFYDDTLEPKRVEIIPTADQGTDILSGNQGGIVENMIEDWLTQYSKATSS